MAKTKILFCCTNPTRKTLRFEKEIAEIERSHRASAKRDFFALNHCWDATTGDWLKAILEHTPDIVHFSGHGASDRILMHEQDQSPQSVTTEALVQLFKMLDVPVRCVVLNSCNSLAIAQAIGKHVPFVVGMDGPIADTFARAFSAGFYAGIFAGCSISQAFSNGLAALALKRNGDINGPNLIQVQPLLKLYPVSTKGDSIVDRRLDRLLDVVYGSLCGKRTGDVFETSENTFDASPLRHYLRVLTHSPEITQLPSLLGRTEKLPVSDMYVELTVSKAEIKPMPELLEQRLTMAEAMEARRRSRTARRTKIIEALDRNPHKHIAIVGDPGGGKTSLMKRVTMDIVSAKMCKWLIPFLIPLRLYWNQKRRQPNLTLTRYMAIRIYETVDSHQYHLYQPLQPDIGEKDQSDRYETLEILLAMLCGIDKRNIVFLLDGFDEIAADKQANESISREINALSYAYSWVLTSRKAGFNGEINTDVRYELVELDDDNIEELVDNWFDHQNHLPGNFRQSLLDQVFKNDRLLMMARNPFLLTLLCYLQSISGNTLPLTRSEVYEQVFASITEFDQSRWGGTALTSEGVNHLGEFCLSLYTNRFRPPRHLFSADDWQQFDSQYRKPDLQQTLCPSRLIDQWADRSIYHLVHLTLHEYLVAKAQFERLSVDVLKRVHNPAWSVVLRFLASMYWHQGRHEDYKALLLRTLEPIDLNGMVLIEAAYILVEAGLKDSTPVIGSDLREMLWSRWRDEQPYIADAAADALAILDPTTAIKRCIDIIEQNKEKVKEAFTNAESFLVAFCDGGLEVLEVKSGHHRAIEFLGRIRHKQAWDYLLSLVEEQAAEYGEVLAKALSWHNTTAVRKQIELSLQDLPIEDPRFKAYCRAAELMAHGDFSNVLCDRLAEARGEDAWPVLSALALLPSSQVAESIIAWLDKKDLGTQESLNALDALVGNHSEAAVNYVLDAYRKGSLEVKLATLPCLVDTGHVPGDEWQHLLAGTTEENIDTVVDRLGDIADGGIVPNRPLVARIRSMLDENPYNDSLFGAYAKMVVSYHEHYQINLAGSFFRGYLSRIEDSKSIRSLNRAVYVCGQLKDLAAQSVLIKTAKSQETQLQITAVGALAELEATPEVFALLRELIQSDEQALASCAIDALAELDFTQVAGLPAEDRVTAALSRVASTRGLLIFKNYFVDKMGILTGWKSNFTVPAKTVFISHAKSDQSIADALCQLLSDNGVPIEDKRLNKAETIIFCVSGEALKSRQKSHYQALRQRQLTNDFFQVRVLLFADALLPIHFAALSWPSFRVDNLDEVAVGRVELLRFLGIG